MEFEQELKEKTRAIENLIKTYLPREEGYQKTVISAMNYAVLAGGKRLRPLLMQETCRLFGGQTRALEPFMAAIEFIHTYSLIHDDLPAMDDDDYRRGRLTVHKVYGEAMAILAGDALLNYAYETAARALVWDANEKTARAMEILTTKAGIDGMVGGQVADVESEKKNLSIDREKLDFIYEKKTGALLEASMTIGAVLGGADNENQVLVNRLAGYLGMAFQIQDDILDVTGTMEELGKPIGSDEKNDKSTYVAQVGIEEAKRLVEEYTGKAVEELERLPGDSTFLKELMLSLINRRK